MYFNVCNLRSGMLESGVDRIITQVVDPKMNHTFRPHIETAIHDFLSGDRKEESTSSLNSAPSEQTEPQEPPSASGPKTPWGVCLKPKAQRKVDSSSKMSSLFLSRYRHTCWSLVVYTFCMAALTFGKVQRRTSGQWRGGCFLPPVQWISQECVIAPAWGCCGRRATTLSGALSSCESGLKTTHVWIVIFFFGTGFWFWFFPMCFVLYQF